MGWVRQWLVTVEYDDRRHLPGLGPTRQYTATTVAQLKAMVLAARADPTVRAFRYTVTCHLDTADEPTDCATFHRSLRGHLHRRAAPGSAGLDRMPN